MASKFKQRYECRLPPAAVRRQPNPEEEAQLYNGSGVAELLRPMGAAPCLVKVGGGEAQGGKRQRGGSPRGIHPDPVFFPIFSRPRTGGRMSSATGSTSSSITWKVTAWAGMVARESQRGGRGRPSPMLSLPLLNSCLLPQSRRSKETFSSSATTSRRSTGTTRRPRCGLPPPQGHHRPLAQPSYETAGNPQGSPSPSRSSPPSPQASKQHRLKRYHSQSYVNGSRCDLTGRAREAEVRVRPQGGLTQAW